MSLFYTSLAIVSLPLLYLVYRKLTRISISDIPGPKSDSFLLGNIPELTLSEFGDIESKWQDEFGDVARIKASLGEERLWIADPSALQHILQTSGYNYPKPPGYGAMDSFFIDRGIVLVDGDIHKRHRKVMLPAFGSPEVKSFVPMFQRVVGKIADQWRVVMKSGQPTELDIPAWLSKATLDTIGKAAFDHEFGAVDNVPDSLSEAYTNIMTDVWGRPSAGKMFFRNIVNYLPFWFIIALCEVLPESSFIRMRHNRVIVHNAAYNLLDTKRKEVSEGSTKKDLMTLLVKANTSDDKKTKMLDGELVPQMRTVLLAGHETTATSLSWTVYELAKQSEVQRRLRKEIWDTLDQVHSRGDSDFQASDYENMSYTNAVINETLRYHSVAVGMERIVGKDDVLPLFKPIVTKSGKTINSIAVPKGLHLMLSIAGYNSVKEIWGDDAADYNPDRWLRPREKGAKPLPTLGVFGNLLTFSAGVRSCIGWRFAIMEMQTFLVALIKDFEFSLPESAPKVRRERALFMVPTVDGEVHLPLMVTPVRR